jgi:hypothetical protein
MVGFTLLCSCPDVDELVEGLTRKAGAEPLAMSTDLLGPGTLEARFGSVLLDAMCWRVGREGSDRHTSNDTTPSARLDSALKGVADREGEDRSDGDR